MTRITTIRDAKVRVLSAGSVATQKNSCVLEDITVDITNRLHHVSFPKWRGGNQNVEGDLLTFG